MLTNKSTNNHTYTKVYLRFDVISIITINHEHLEVL